MLVELDDRGRIAAWCAQRPAVQAYLLGDLDDFFWPYTRWFGWERDGRLTQVALLYTEPEVPVLLAFGDEGSEALPSLLSALAPVLPDRIHAHVGLDGLSALEGSFAVENGPEPHLRLCLATGDALPLHAPEPVEQLGVGDRVEVEAFFAAAYPGSWFHPRMLETGWYVGIRSGGELACVAGVHVHSRTYSVAVLGNVATHPSARGRGLASAACATLCERLLADGIETIALNVHAGNAPALRIYERLGFVEVTTFVEVGLAARAPTRAAARPGDRPRRDRGRS